MSLNERKLKPSEKKRLKKYEKEVPKKDFEKRYGKKKGSEIYYATITKMAKKKVDEMYSSSAQPGFVRIGIVKGGEEHKGRVERSQHQGLKNVMEDELEEADAYHWDEPSWHYNGGYGDPESKHAKWYLEEQELDEKKDRKGASASYCRKTPCKEMGFTQKASCKSQGIKDCYRGKSKDEGKDPKVGTGKKPKGSGRRLYTDEDPTDTVSVEFSSVAAIKRTLAKSSFKSKSHKRQSQIINLIHQRVRAAYKNAKDPKVKARLKKAFEYAKKRKEASKKKTKARQKKNEMLYRIIREELNEVLTQINNSNDLTQ